VDIHPPPSSSTNGPSGDSKRVESNDGDSDLYELIPSEKEFGTLGNARPVLRGVSHPIKFQMCRLRRVAGDEMHFVRHLWGKENEKW